MNNSVSTVEEFINNLKGGKMTKKELEVRKLLNVPKDLSSIIVITPEQARLILSSFNTHNRKKTQSKIKQYMMAMLKGQWRLSNDCITFKDGILTNGQHRLEAVALSNLPQPFNVCFSVENFMDMDTPKPRSLKENALLSDDCDKRLAESTINFFPIVKTATYFSQGSYTIPRGSQRDFAKLADKYADELVALGDACLFSNITISLGTKKSSITSASVFSAYLLAYLNGVDIEVLKHIHKVLKAGVPDTDYDKIILSLRDILLTTIGGGVDPSIIRCTATQECIYKFCKKSKSKSLTHGNYYYTFPDFKLD